MNFSYSLEASSTLQKSIASVGKRYKRRTALSSSSERSGRLLLLVFVDELGRVTASLLSFEEVIDIEKRGKRIRDQADRQCFL